MSGQAVPENTVPCETPELARARHTEGALLPPQIKGWCSWTPGRVRGGRPRGEQGLSAVAGAEGPGQGLDPGTRRLGKASWQIRCRGGS